MKYFVKPKHTILLVSFQDVTEHRQFVKRVSDFFKPSYHLFSKLELISSKAKFLAKIGCFLLDFLVAGKSVINVWEWYKFCGSALLFFIIIESFKKMASKAKFLAKIGCFLLDFLVAGKSVITFLVRLV
jgi:hypothetical protein